VKWSEMKWNEVKWSEMKWNEVKWSEMKWSDVNVTCIVTWYVTIRDVTSHHERGRGRGEGRSCWHGGRGQASRPNITANIQTSKDIQAIVSNRRPILFLKFIIFVKIIISGKLNNSFANLHSRKQLKNLAIIILETCWQLETKIST